jgi:integrase
MAKGRRGNREGTIDQLPSGKWRARVTLEGRAVTKSFRTRREGQDWVRQMAGQIEQGLGYEATRTSLGDYLEGWLVSISSSVNPKTAGQYRQIARDHIIPNIGKHKLANLRPDHVQALYNKKVAEGKGLRTIELIHSVLHNALGQALKQGIVMRNVTDATTPPRPKEKEMRILSEEESSRLLASAAGHPLEPLFYLAALTGMRRGELLGLKWGDLDWITGELKIRRQVQMVKGEGSILVDVKTAKSRRTLVLGEFMLETLRGHYEVQQEQRRSAGNTWKEHDLIFPSRVGTPLCPTNFDKRRRELFRRAGIEARFHDLRHLATSIMLVKLRMSPTEVAAILGHSRTSTTLDIYGHMLPGMEAETARRMERLIVPVKVG